MTDGYCSSGWSSVPEYVSRTAGIRLHMCGLWLLSAWGLTGRWCNRPRSQHLCHLCGTGVGDESHVVFECPCQDVPRQLHGRPPPNPTCLLGLGVVFLGSCRLPENMRLCMAQDAPLLLFLSMHAFCIHKSHINSVFRRVTTRRGRFPTLFSTIIGIGKLHVVTLKTTSQTALMSCASWSICSISTWSPMVLLC